MVSEKLREQITRLEQEKVSLQSQINTLSAELDNVMSIVLYAASLRIMIMIIRAIVTIGASPSNHSSPPY